MSAPTTTAPVTFTREQAKEADRVLNELMYETARKEQAVSWAKSSLRHLVDRETGWGRDRRWGKSFEQAYTEVVAQAATVDPERPWTAREAQEALDKLAATQAALEAAEAAEEAQGQLWFDHGMWNRYSVVPGGHIHTNGRACHTLRPSTTVLWAHPVSGDTVADAIETYGTVLCSHCFPEAPVEQTGGKVLTDADGNPLTLAQAKAIADAKAAEKAAKLAAKNAKAVFVPGTTDLVQGPDLYEIKTERSLVTAIVDAMYTYGFGERLDRKYRDKDNYPTYREWIDYAISALAAKHGKTVEEVRAEMDKKLQAKNRRG